MIKKISLSLIWWITGIMSLVAIYFFTASFLAVAAIVLLVIIPLITWAMNFYIRKHISISLRLPSTGVKNKEAVAEIFLVNDSVFPLWRAYVELMAENTLTGERMKNIITLSSAQHSQVRGEFVLCSDKCGYVNVSVKKVYLSDMFGFLPLRADISAEGKMSVMPDTFDMSVSMGVSYISRMDEDTYSPDKSGSDFSETFQIREYIPGDSLKQIHWKLSDKLDKIVVREASLPVSRSLLVFWDKNTCEQKAEEMDATAEVISSLCQALCDEGVLFTLGWTDDQENTFEEITQTEDLFRCVGQMLKSGNHPGISGAERYAEQSGKAEFGKIIYIAGAVPVNFGSFVGADATVVLCTDKAYDSEYNLLTFKSDTYLTDMQTVEL